MQNTFIKQTIDNILARKTVSAINSDLNKFLYFINENTDIEIFLDIHNYFNNDEKIKKILTKLDSSVKSKINLHLKNYWATYFLNNEIKNSHMHITENYYNYFSISQQEKVIHKLQTEYSNYNTEQLIKKKKIVSPLSNALKKVKHQNTTLLLEYIEDSKFISCSETTRIINSIKQIHDIDEKLTVLAKCLQKSKITYEIYGDNYNFDYSYLSASPIIFQDYFDIFFNKNNGNLDDDDINFYIYKPISAHLNIENNTSPHDYYNFFLLSAIYVGEQIYLTGQADNILSNISYFFSKKTPFTKEIKKQHDIDFSNDGLFNAISYFENKFNFKKESCDVYESFEGYSENETYDNEGFLSGAQLFAYAEKYYLHRILNKELPSDKKNKNKLKI